MAIDISDANTKEIIFKSPDDTVKTKTAEFKNDGTDGELTYTTSEGDIDVEGLWFVQGCPT